MSDSKGCYFLSDIHLRERNAPGEREKQEQLCAFLRHLTGRAVELFVVGDLFDYWFEYRSVVPRRGGRVLSALADLVDSGVPVTAFGGNHDWWLGPSLTEEYGIAVRREPLWHRAQGRRIYIDHGDGLSIPSRTYSGVRAMLHGRLAIRAFRAVHPDWGAKAARLVSERSHRKIEAETPALQVVPVFEKIAGEAFAAGADIAVFGHVHAARMEVSDAGVLVVLGDWIRLRTYGELVEGAFALKTWRFPGSPVTPVGPG